MLRILSIAGALALAAPAVAQNATQKPPEAAKSPEATPEQALSAAVAADWPKYDQKGKGHLTHDEFATWLTGLRRQSAGTAEDPVKLKAWADTSFAKADSNSDRQVTPEEFTAFLQTKLKK